MLLEPHHREVNADERQDDSRDQQNVQRIHSRQEEAVLHTVVTHTAAGEVASEQRPVQPGADDRHAERDRRHRGPQPDAREQVVGQGVAEVPLEHRQDEQQRADDPVGLAGTAERAGEEDAGEVHHDGRGEQQCRPVVYLADEQAAAHIEADVQGRLVGLRHLHTAQRLVDTVVGDLGHRRVEEQAQVDPGDEQNDEAVQRDLAQQEGPVGREHLVQLAPDRRRRVITRIDGVALVGRDLGHARRFRQCWTHDFRSQNAGPTGSMKSPLATRYPSWSIVMGSCANARAAGPNMGLAKCNASNCDWWHGQRMR